MTDRQPQEPRCCQVRRSLRASYIDPQVDRLSRTQTSANWRSRRNVVFRKSRSLSRESESGKGKTRNFVLVDLLSTVKRKTSALRVGVENLFDEQYFPGGFSQTHKRLSGCTGFVRAAYSTER